VSILFSAAQAQVVYAELAKGYRHFGDVVQSMDLDKDHAEKLGEDLNDTDARMTAYHLQSVVRLLAASKDFKKSQHEIFENLLDDTKKLEDIMGKMAEDIGSLKAAKKKGVSDKKLDELKDDVEDRSKELRKTFKDLGWLDADRAEKTVTKLSFMSDLAGEKEISIIKTAVRGEILFFVDKIQTKLIPDMTQAEFSHNSMEYNFHEFRRSIRWISFYIQSLPEIFSLSNSDPLSAEQKQVIAEYGDNQFAKLDSSGSPVTIDRYSFTLLAKYVTQAGEAKDEAEKHFKFLEKGIPSELDEDKFKTEMVQMMQDFLDSGLTDKILENLKENI
jgi:hypothetical protein